MSYESGAHDSPVDTNDRLLRIGSKYQATAPAVADGDNVYLLVDTAGRLLISGPVPHDAVFAGNPVPGGGFATGDVSAESDVASGDATRLLATLKGLALSSIVATNGGTAGDGRTNGDLTQFFTETDAEVRAVVQAYPSHYNESTWDRVRGNTEKAQLASAARTTSTNGPDQTNYNHKGVIITLDVTVDPGSGETLQLLVQHKDSVAGSYELLLDDGANATPGRRTVILYPGIGAAANDVNTIAGYPLPRTWRVRVVHSASGTWNYSVAASPIL